MPFEPQALGLMIIAIKNHRTLGRITGPKSSKNRAKMKTIFQISVLALLFIGGPVSASEPIECYKRVWGSSQYKGMSIPVGSATELCSGATNAKKVVQCFAEAWGHPDNGGLGLPLGQAVKLCKTNSLPSS